MPKTKRLSLFLPILLMSLTSTTEVAAGKVAQLAGITTISAFIYCGCKIAKDNEEYRLVMDKNQRAMGDRLNKNSTEPKLVLDHYSPPADKVFELINTGLILSSNCMVIASRLLKDLSSTVFKSNPPA